MKASWTKGLEPELEKEIRGDFLSSRIVRHRLITILEEKIKSAQILAMDKDGYNIPNWAFKQADLIGFQRALKEIIDLVSD